MQLYAISIVLSGLLSFVLLPVFWDFVLRRNFPYIIAAVLVIIVNRVIVQQLIGDHFVNMERGRQVRQRVCSIPA